MYEPTGGSVPTGRPTIQMFPLDDHVAVTDPQSTTSPRPDRPTELACDE